MQTEIEKRIDFKFAQVESPSRGNGTAHQKNTFFNGIMGKAFTKSELDLVKAFENDSEQGPMNAIFFCLPAKFCDEVQAKPPTYKHIHSIKYKLEEPPAPIKHTGGVCGCVYHCDEACLNRILYIECTTNGADGEPNCSVGKSCGNRQLGQRIFKTCSPKREEGKGWGLVVQEDVKKGELIIEYVGEVIDEKSKQDRLESWTKQHPNNPNFYIMELGNEHYVDARHEGNLSRFINHACEPNATVRTVNVNGYLRNGVFALRDIRAGSFLSCDYQFETKQGERFVCRCGSSNCRGTMRRASTTDRNDNKSKKQLWEAAKREYDRDKAFLEDFHTKQRQRRSQVSAMVPESEFPSDLVANGPLERHRREAALGRLFLWRNASLGGDFATRFARLEAKAKR